MGRFVDVCRCFKVNAVKCKVMVLGEGRELSVRFAQTGYI